MDKQLLRSEFVPELNPGLNFDSLPPFSNCLVRWRCNKNHHHEWSTKFQARRNCPFCTNRRLSPDGTNSFAALYPELVTEWHPENKLRPQLVSGAPAQEVRWICSWGHEWEATPNTRVSMGTGCPFCSGRRCSPLNSLAALRSELIVEWNDPKSPKEISCGSHYLAWWKCSRGHRWQSKVQERANKNKGCPFCSGRLVAADTSLLVTAPAIAAEWHPLKNRVTPERVSKGSGEKVWWRCRDGHEWEATIKDRVGKSSGCPICVHSFPGLEKKMEEILGISRFNRFPLNTRDELPYKPDFKLKSNIFLNVDGLYWHSEACRERNYHFKMRQDFLKKGLRLLQFYEDEVWNKSAIIKSIVSVILGCCDVRIFARKCSVAKVADSEAQEFLSINHIIGGVLASRHLGLYYDGKLVHLMSVRFTGSVLEITRSCSKLNTIISGGFSKLLAAFIKNLKPVEIITYIDLRYADGHSLEKTGFKLENTVLDYQYTRSKERKDKRAFRVKAGQDEVALAAAQGWVRIFNAGRARYRLKCQR